MTSNRSHLMLLILIFICAVQNQLIGQDNLYYSDRIWMKNGSVFVGEVISVTESQIELALKSGNSIFLQRSDVRKVIQYNTQQSEGNGQYMMFGHQSHKHIFKLDAGLGFTHIDGEIFPSLEIGGNYLHRLTTSSLLGLRLNVKSVTNSDYYSLPVLEYQLEYVRFLGVPEKIQPFLSMRAGIGHVLSYNDVNNDRIRGLGIQPGGSIQLGLIKTIGSRSAFVTEFGFNWQRYKYKVPSFWWGNGQRLESLAHLTLRIGYMF
jgi:preprotein translocase subunit YajC